MCCWRLISDLNNCNICCVAWGLDYLHETHTRWINFIFAIAQGGCHLAKSKYCYYFMLLLLENSFIWKDWVSSESISKHSMLMILFAILSYYDSLKYLHALLSYWPLLKDKITIIFNTFELQIKYFKKDLSIHLWVIFKTRMYF